MSLQGRRLIRKMRGGAQAHLIEANDGAFYVVKFVNNPQHRRILVNEWLATSFLRNLQIHVPDCAVIELTENRRQVEAWERAALDQLRVGRGGWSGMVTIVDCYQNEGRLHLGESPREVRAAMVADWGPA